MMTLWLALAALIAVALGFLLPPLWRAPRGGTGGHAARNLALHREQLAELERDLRSGLLAREHYEESRRELEQRMLADAEAGEPHAAPSGRNRMLAAALLLMLPLTAVPLYLKLGSPRAVLEQSETTQAMNAEHGGGEARFDQMIDKLAQRLRDQNPEDGQGWWLLASSYAQSGRFVEAAAAFDRASRLVPSDARLLADYADVQAMANGRRFDGKPDELIRQALAADPANPKALMLAASSAFLRQDYREAQSRWEALLRLLPPDSDDARMVAGNIAEAERMLAPKKQSEAGRLDNLAEFSARGETAPAKAATVSGTVSLSPALAARAAPNDRLRVFARAANGPRMPLAMVEARVKDLPLKFTLSDDLAMAPEMKLSAFPEVVVVARAARSGAAQASSGDLQGTSGAVKLGATGLRIVIDTVVP